MNINLAKYNNIIFCEIKKTDIDADKYPILYADNTYFVFIEDYFKEFYKLNILKVVYHSEDKIHLFIANPIDSEILNKLEYYELCPTVTENPINGQIISAIRITIYVKPIITD